MSPRRAWHPILVALFPVLSTFAANRAEVAWDDLLLPCVAAVGAAALVWAALVKPCGGWAPAALVASPLLLVLLTAGHALRAAGRGDRGAYALIGLQVGLLLAALAAFAWRDVGARWLTALLNRVALAAMLLPIGSIALWSAAAWSLPASTLSSRDNDELHASTGGAAASSRKPDIYYIVLDGFARADVLTDQYGCDSAAFLEGLEQRGFRVARQSTANYPITVASLASSLNCRYHDEKGQGAPAYDQLIRDSFVVRFLRVRGYKHVAFATGYGPTEVRGADEYLTLPHAGNSFRFLVQSNSLLTLLDRGANLLAEHRQRILFTFDSLAQVAESPELKFVFAHIICPHPPFLFGAQGEDVTDRRAIWTLSDGAKGNQLTEKEYVAGYRAQATFMMGRVLEAIDAIKHNASTPPIIVLQSDHGPDSRDLFSSPEPSDDQLRERFGNLNAYHLPEGIDASVYDDITPVNSFRMVFNAVFGTRLELLPDECYFPDHDPFWRLISARVRKRSTPKSPDRHTAAVRSPGI